jgi:hypothetical protein
MGGECVGGRLGNDGGEAKTRREWMRRGIKRIGRVYKKRGESEGGKNRDKKIVMVHLTIQKKNHVEQQPKVQSAQQKFWTYSFVSSPGIGA